MLRIRKDPQISASKLVVCWLGNPSVSFPRNGERKQLGSLAISSNGIKKNYNLYGIRGCSVFTLHTQTEYFEPSYETFPTVSHWVMKHV